VKVERWEGGKEERREGGVTKAPYKTYSMVSVLQGIFLCGKQNETPLAANPKNGS
jgi:hypothetical protein